LSLIYTLSLHDALPIFWKWDPVTERSGKGAPRQRGLVYWQNDTGGERRLFTGVGGFLFALDAKTGEVVRSFGENGSINLGSGLKDRKSTRLNSSHLGIS